MGTTLFTYPVSRSSVDDQLRLSCRESRSLSGSKVAQIPEESSLSELAEEVLARLRGSEPPLRRASSLPRYWLQSEREQKALRSFFANPLYKMPIRG
jgi:hypothetical protein